MQTDFSRPLQPASIPDWARILGRKPENSGTVSIQGAAGRRVLVTGAGGFIGSEMVRVLAASEAERIVLLELAEPKLCAISAEMAARGYGHRCIPVLGSVCDRNLLQAIFAVHRTELILHAAALKHVPLMESQPLAAVETNSVGTWLLARIAAAHGAERMILVSTDKAVAPHSIMGASKRIAELAMLTASPIRSTVVRLANVIGSPGSVGPVFADQIARGGPVTVTHRAARRFFLTLAEVTGLLAQAFDSDSAEGILVPDPGEPMLMAELAQRMIGWHGHDVPVVFTALRPGDKLDEALISSREHYDGPATSGLRRVVSPAAVNFEERIRALQSGIDRHDGGLVLRLVQELVPDYEPSALLRETTPAFASSPP